MLPPHRMERGSGEPSSGNPRQAKEVMVDHTDGEWSVNFVKHGSEHWCFLEVCSRKTEASLQSRCPVEGSESWDLLRNAGHLRWDANMATLCSQEIGVSRLGCAVDDSHRLLQARFVLIVHRLKEAALQQTNRAQASLRVSPTRQIRHQQVHPTYDKLVHLPPKHGQNHL